MISCNISRSSPITFLLITLYNLGTFTRAYIHTVCAYRIRTVPIAEREIGALSYPLDRTLGVAHNSALTPFAVLIPPGIMHTRGVCKGELATRRATDATQVSRNFYRTIRAIAHENYAPTRAIRFRKVD